MEPVRRCVLPWGLGVLVRWGEHHGEDTGFLGCGQVLPNALRTEDHPGAPSDVSFPFSLPDEDGSVILRPGNKYEYKFGFELPQG